jgi:hypothetical protein
MIIPSLNQWVAVEWIIFRVSDPPPPTHKCLFVRPWFQLVKLVKMMGLRQIEGDGRIRELRVGGSYLRTPWWRPVLGAVKIPRGVTAHQKGPCEFSAAERLWRFSFTHLNHGRRAKLVFFIYTP